MFQPFPGIGRVFLEQTLGVILRERGKAISVQEIQVIQIRAGGERVLGENNVAFAWPDDLGHL